MEAMAMRVLHRVRTRSLPTVMYDNQIGRWVLGASRYKTEGGDNYWEFHVLEICGGNVLQVTQHVLDDGGAVLSGPNATHVECHLEMAPTNCRELRRELQRRCGEGRVFCQVVHAKIDCTRYRLAVPLGQKSRLPRLIAAYGGTLLEPGSRMVPAAMCG